MIRPRHASITLALLTGIFVLTLLAVYDPHRAFSASDVILSCDSCAVGQGEASALVQWIRNYDLIFEGVCVGRELVPGGYEKGRVLTRFRVDRVFKGASPSGQVVTEPPIASEGPAVGARVLGWVLRRCTADGWPCANYIRIAEDGMLYHPVISTDWRPDARRLTCDALESLLKPAPGAGPLPGLDTLTALGVASLSARTPFPDNGGTWRITDIRWLFGPATDAPRAVRFTRNASGNCLATEFHSGDQFLVACSASGTAMTIAPGMDWRRFLVKDGLSVAFGLPVDSLSALYQVRGDQFVLRSATFPGIH